MTTLLVALPWLIFYLLFVPSYVKGNSDDTSSIVSRTLFLASVIAIFGYFIPTTWPIWIRFGAFHFGFNFIILYC